ncbi:MAG: DUF2147 domain-containing protein [Myxococcales bacterium]|nr:DUF2147 domain-containing protein [Myxococcales bacterium]MCB9641906.1 DUF2147 domain-containing protein [Myxococcales bacterium]
MQFTLRTIFLALAFAVAFNATAFAKGDMRVIGKWKTIDDKTKQAKSIVEIKLVNGKLTGKILKLFRKKTENQDPSCDKCTGNRKDKKIIGMTIIWDMTPKNDVTWGHGKILDPANGKQYGCSIWLDSKNPNRLKVRGWLAFFFRDQTWHRAN